MLHPVAASLRARNRGRMGLQRFNTDLCPSLHEMAVDRVRLKVSGRWAARGPRSEMLNRFQDYLQYIGTADPVFERVGTRGRRSFLTIRKTAPLTLRGNITLVRDLDAPNNLFVNLDVNPTRTLEHLLQQYGHRRDFAVAVAEMLPVEFFQRSPAPRIASGGSENFISYVSLARLRLGNDIFGSFLPIYVGQLRAWVEQTLFWGEYHHLFRHTNGVTEIATYFGDPSEARPEDFVVRLDWSQVSLNLTEVYFERHHGQAHLAVERLARSSLAGLRDVHVRRYDNDPDELETADADDGEQGMPLAAGVLDHVRRAHGELSVSGKLTSDRRYTIYAKNDGRLRFELKYDGLPLAHDFPTDVDPSTPLISRLEAARQAAMSDMRWANVGAYCTELPRSAPDAMADLIEAVDGAVGDEPTISTASIIRELLTSGGLTEDAELLPRPVLERLERRGVVEHRPMRNRGARGSGRRYLLAPAYLALREALSEAPHI